MYGSEMVSPPYPATFIEVNKNSPGATCKNCIFPAGISNACTSFLTNSKQKPEEIMIAIRLFSTLCRSSSRWSTNGISEDGDPSTELALSLILIGGGALKVFSFGFGLARFGLINDLILIDNWIWKYVYIFFDEI